MGHIKAAHAEQNTDARRDGAPATLTPAQILQRVGERSFERGERYARRGAIADAVVRGQTLEATCEGDSGTYGLRVRFAGARIAEAECDCPVGDGGRCKHVAALLLTWLRSPEAFAAREPIDAALARLDKPRLVALVKRMIEHEPGLESLLALPLPGEKPADAGAYQRQALRLLRDDGQWDSARRAARQLGSLLRAAEGFLEASDPAGAATVYAGVAEAVLRRFESFHDEGDLTGVLSDCGDGLSECFMTLPPGAARAAVLAALWRLVRADIDIGGFGFGDEACETLLQRASDEEKRTIEGWARDAMADASEYARESYGRLILALLSGAETTEEAERVCREAGLGPELVERLLKRGRAAEAVAALQSVPRYRLLELAKLFDRHEQGRAFEDCVRSRAETPEGAGLWDWLRARCAKRGDDEAALGWAERMFRQMPSLEGFARLAEYATRLGRWEGGLRERWLKHLRQQGNRGLLVEIALADGDLEAALDLVTLPLPRGSRVSEASLLAVARAAESELPLRAAGLYRAQAERWIEQQGRENYARACGVLARAARLMRGAGRETEWENDLLALRERHRAKRSFKEELLRAGL